MTDSRASHVSVEHSTAAHSEQPHTAVITRLTMIDELAWRGDNRGSQCGGRVKERQSIASMRRAEDRIAVKAPVWSQTTASSPDNSDQ